MVRLRYLVFGAEMIMKKLGSSILAATDDDEIFSKVSMMSKLIFLPILTNPKGLYVKSEENSCIFDVEYF